jgi:hypothetical protein
VREACAEAGTLPKPHSGRRIAPDDQLDDQLRDPVVARKEDPNHAVL